MQTQWDHTKDIINAALGMGFGHDRDSVNLAYQEIDGDFGTPTESDVSDFKASIQKLEAGTIPEAIAKDLCILALNLYLQNVNA